MFFTHTYIERKIVDDYFSHSHIQIYLKIFALSSHAYNFYKTQKQTLKNTHSHITYTHSQTHITYTFTNTKKSYLSHHTHTHAVKKHHLIPTGQMNTIQTQTEVLEYHKGYVVKEQRLASRLPSLRHSTRDLPSVTLPTTVAKQGCQLCRQKTQSECNSITAAILQGVTSTPRNGLVIVCSGVVVCGLIHQPSPSPLGERFAAHSQPLLRVPL